MLSDSRDMLREAHELLTRNREGVRETLTGALDTQHFVGPCALCGGALRLARSPRGARWVQCVNNPGRCTATYNLPSAGFIEPAPEFLCGTCKVPRVKITFRGQRPDLYCINPECAEHHRAFRIGSCPNCASPLEIRVLLPREAVRGVHRLSELPGHLPIAPTGQAREGSAAVPDLPGPGGDRDRGGATPLDALYQSGVSVPREEAEGRSDEEGPPESAGPQEPRRPGPPRLGARGRSHRGSRSDGDPPTAGAPGPQGPPVRGPAAPRGGDRRRAAVNRRSNLL